MTAGTAQRGFTLVELLVAITVLALVGALVTGLVQVVQGGWTRVQARVEDGERDRIARDLLRRVVEGALPFAERRGDAPLPLFDGDPGTLRLVGEAPSWAAPALLRIWRIEARPTETGERQLVVQRADVAPGVEPLAALEGAAEVTLLRAQRIELAYLTAEAGSGPSWRERWSELGKLPRAVRVTIADEAGSPRETLLLPLRVDAEARCSGAGAKACGVE